jgi:hypothetical protein
MPVGATLAAAAVSAGSAIYSSNQASDAAQNASDAQSQSNAEALALNKAQADRTDAEYAPWRTVGASALQMLARTENIQVPANTFSYYNLPAANSNTTGGTAAGAGTGGTTTPAAPQQLTPGISAGQAYLNANPDVLAEYNKILPTVDWNSPWAAQHGFVQGDPGAFGDWHYQTSGQSEGRAAGVAVAPTYAPATPTSATSSTGAPANNNTLTTPATSGPQAYDANGLPITNTPGKPTGLIPGSTSAVPAGANPQYGDFYASPDYQFRLNQGTTAITGNAAAKGLLDSGSLGKGLIDYGQQAASQEFGSWYNRIASLAGVGQTAVAGSAAAGAASTAAQTGILQSQGAQTASSIATQGGINSGLITSLGGTASGLIQNLGAQPSALPVQSNGFYQGNLTTTPVNSNVAGLTSGVPSDLFGSPI